MKVLFVTRGFPSEKEIMAGNYEAVQAKALSKKGCQVSVISAYECPLWHFRGCYRITHRIAEGIDVYEVKYGITNIRIVRRISRYLRNWVYRNAFKKYVLEKGMPDIVHAHIIMYAAYTSFLKTEYHLPVVITEHWTQMNVNDIPAWIRGMAFVYRLADQVICVSQALSDSLKTNFLVDSIIINNMVSDSFFKDAKVDRNDDLFNFVAVGAFRKNKRFDILVESFAQCHFSDNIRLSIVGDGEERELIESIIRTHQLSNQVKLLGTKTLAEVNDLLCHSDCFVLSSRLETFAIVVIEAMAKGLPVIATRSGGPETFLQPEHGLLVEKENVKELSDAMKYMILHYTDYDSNMIRKYCREHFSQDVIANQIINVYNKVLSR